MQQHLNGIAPGARLRDFSMPDPQDLQTQFYLHYSFELPDYAVKAGTLRLFQFPDRERTFPEIRLDQRRYPLVYITTEAYTRTTRLTLPETLVVAEVPENVRIAGPSVVYTEQFQVAPGEIVLTLHYERHRRHIPVKDYRAYRGILKRIEERTGKPFYFDLAGDVGTGSACR
jgi:hypothetical protein